MDRPVSEECIHFTHATSAQLLTFDHTNRNVSRWRFINAAILMNFMGSAASEDIVAADRNGDMPNDDIDEDAEIEGMIDRYIVRSNSDPGEIPRLN